MRHTTILLALLLPLAACDLSEDRVTNPAGPSEPTWITATADAIDLSCEDDAYSYMITARIHNAQGPTSLSIDFGDGRTTTIEGVELRVPHTYYGCGPEPFEGYLARATATFSDASQAHVDLVITPCLEARCP